MKKVLITTALAGFVRSFLYNDIKILQERGFEVHCAANRKHPGADGIEEYFKDNNVIFHQIDFSSNKPFSRQSCQSYQQIHKLVKEHNYTLIHCHTPIAGAIVRIAVRKNRKRGTKVIYTTHGFYFHKESSKKSWLIFHSVENIMSYFTDMIITINQEDYGNAKKMHCKNVKYINGVGVNTERFINCTVNKEAYRKKIGVGINDLMILSIGELSNRKNHQVVIKALGKLKLPNAVFVICGNAMTDQATTEQLKEIADEQKIKLLLLGLRKDIPEICQCADIGVISSTREGLGLAGIEMLASGLPLVASSVHGIIDYAKDGITGFLANPYSVNEFAKGIDRLTNKEVRESFIPDCIEMARKFDCTISNTQMKNIYEELMG